MSGSRQFSGDSPSKSPTYKSDDDKNQLRSKSPRSDKTERSRTDPLTKRVSTQTPSDIPRSISSSSLNISRQQSNSLILTGDVSRSDLESHKIPLGISARRITEKKAYSKPSTSSEDVRRQKSYSSKTRSPNDKSQMVTYESIIQATRQQQLSDQLIANNIIKVFIKTKCHSVFVTFFS